MAAETHSFIDIAALDGVRRHFAAGDAVVILSTDLARIVWCNGPGAALLGFSGIEAAIEAEAGLSRAAKRQIEAVPGYPAIGADRPVAVRLAAGMISQIAALRASSLALPGGETAVMLVSPVAHLSSRSESEVAAHAIGGFEEAGNYVALLGANGGILAATPGFDRLGLGRPVLEKLVVDVAVERDRLLKRIVRADGRAMPVGFAHLTDDPAQYLLITVDEGGIDAEGPAAIETPAGGVDAPQNAASVQPVADVGAAVATPGSGETAPGAAGDPIEAAPETATDVVAAASEQEEATPAGDGPKAPPLESPAASVLQQNVTETEAGPERPTPAASQHDSWYFSDRTPSDSPSQRVPLAVDGESAPVRFVWRTDAEGRFSSISPEFVLAVGAEAGDVVGRSFGDVARRLALDPDEEITGLLARRDTWSGRSVLWPVAGTDLKVPVDLAALPAYGRDREFEGFRGFGVVRAGDTVVDPDAIGMSLVRPREAPAEADAPVAEGQADASGAEPAVTAEAADRPEAVAAADPFQGEVPALEISQKPQRRFSDKVIRLAEHRMPANDKGLTPLERNAFREIGEQLKRDVAPGAATAGDGKAEAGAVPQETPRGETGIDRREPLAVGMPTAPVADDAARETPPAEPIPAETSAARTVAATDAPEWQTPLGTQSAEIADASRTDIVRADAATDEAAPESAASFEAIAVPELETPPLSMEEEVRDDVFIVPAADEEQPVSTAADDEAAPIASADGDEIPAADAADGDPAPVSQDTAGASATAVREEDVRAADETAAPSALETPVADETPPRDRVSRSLLDFAAADDGAAATPAVDAATGDGAAATGDGNAPGVEATAISEEAVVADEAGEATVPGGDAEAPPGTVATAEPQIPSPPLKQSGFLPSAFAERGEKQADTSILAQLPIPVLVHAGDTLHYANDAFLELTGYETLDQLASEGGLDALFSGPAVDRRDGDNRVMLRTRRGDELPVCAFLQSVPWLGGKALLLTLTRQATGTSPVPPAPAADEQDLRARVAELRTILDTATDGVVLIGNDGMVSSISRPAEALFGYDSDELVGKPFTSLFAIESQRAARDYLSGLTEHGVASVLNDGREVIGREAQGRFIPLFMTIGRLPGNGGFCAVLRDITQWKRAEEDLTQARALAERTSSQKSDFLARVSHEIRTPLNAIIGFSELMLDEKFGPVANDRYRDYLRDINRSGNHVLDLVNDLLDISKIEAGQQEMDYEAVALNDALGETVAMMQPQANRERVIIRSSFASKLPEVVADLRSVRQIALNILSNAVRYTQAGGQVIVSTAHEPNGDVVMRVRDTGIGMTQAEIEQALKPFKQVNALKRARGDGTGLGLPLTKAMVEANRAKFAIYSTPGEGTLVEITFPSTRVLAE